MPGFAAMLYHLYSALVVPSPEEAACIPLMQTLLTVVTQHVPHVLQRPNTTQCRPRPHKHRLIPACCSVCVLGEVRDWHQHVQVNLKAMKAVQTRKVCADEPKHHHVQARQGACVA